MARRGDGFQPFEGPAGELHGRPPGRQVDHPHVAPENALAKACAERLRAGLLGGEALGVGLDAVGAPLGLGALGRGEDAVEEAVAVARQRLLDAPRVAQVRAEADDHERALARPRSMAARIILMVSASPSNTASPIRKWPMFNSITCGSAAIVS